MDRPPKRLTVQRAIAMAHAVTPKRAKVPIGYWDDKTCTREGCERPVKTKGLCVAHYKAESRRKNRGHREWHLRSKYGLTIEQYKAMLEAQKHRCKICLTELHDRNRTGHHVDHCHETGKVRGILCQRCNHVVGSSEAEIERLRNAIAYLEDFYSTVVREPAA